MATWDQLDTDSLLKKQLGSRVNPGLGSAEIAQGNGHLADSFGHNGLSHLGRSQTPLQGALNSPSGSFVTNNQSSTNGIQTPVAHPPPGLQPITKQSDIPQNPITASLLSENSQQQQQQQPQQKSEEELTNLDRYGLNGLLSLIKMENSDQTTVAIGTDLNLLGLDMSENAIDEKLSKTFSSPWVETSRSEVEPEFRTPNHFKVENLPPIQEKLNLFPDETLFYIFYTKTRDLLQELAARELMNRNWRYHKELQVWLTKDSNSEPIQQSPQSERGIYIFFDPHSWEKVRKEFVLYYQSIMS